MPSSRNGATAARTNGVERGWRETGCCRGTNPEELIAAAHAGCYARSLSMILGEAGVTAESIDTRAEVALDKIDDGFAITAVRLTLKASVPGVGGEIQGVC
ncbi:MAG: OsmC family peroxiredoxin [Chromatocurvus sp.]